MLLDKFMTKVWIGLADLGDKGVCFLPIVMFSLIAHFMINLSNLKPNE